MGKRDELREQIEACEALLCEARKGARANQKLITEHKKNLARLQEQLKIQKIFDATPKPTALETFHNSYGQVDVNGGLRWFKVSGWTLEHECQKIEVRHAWGMDLFNPGPATGRLDAELHPGGQLFARLPTREELLKLLGDYVHTGSWKGRIDLASAASQGGPIVPHHACRGILKLIAGLFGVPFELIVELSCPDGIDATSYAKLFATPSEEK